VGEITYKFKQFLKYGLNLLWRNNNEKEEINIKKINICVEGDTLFERY